MKCLVLNELKTPLEVANREAPSPSAGEVVVDLKAAALNRRDYWITQGMYPGVTMPVILGSDGAGVISQVGEGVDANWIGREVVINPGWDWGDNPSAQSSAFQILGMPDDGTFAEQVVVPAIYLHEKPEHLDWQSSAALPLGGVTAFRALFTQGRCVAGENVLINGIGGGVATTAMQFALAAGAKVFVTSSSQEKIDRAISLGAAAGFNYTEENWHKETRSQVGSMDLIVDSGGGEGYANLVDLAVAGGRIVNYGATAGPPKKFDLFKMFWKQLHLIGTTMGSPADFQAMLEFVNEHKIEPIVDAILPLDDGNAALEKMKSSSQFGKIVLDIAS